MRRKTEEKPLVTAIIAAAGKSSRMGGVDKQLAPLCGVPVLARAIAAFEASALVDEIVVVVSAAGFVPAANLVKEYDFQKVVRIVAGGETRQQSAAAGFGAVNPATAFVAVHDGARPLILPPHIDAVIAEAFRTGAAAAAVPVKDTVKIADENGFVRETPARESLWAVQTPQVFEAGLYRAALKAAGERGSDFTDDCQLVEALGRRVRLVRCDYTNLKITTPEDLLFAEAILQSGAQREECAERGPSL